MNNNWQKVKLGEVCEIFNGTTPSTKIPEYWNGEIPWITPKDLSFFDERYIKQGERNISEEGLANSTRRLLPKNTILFSSRAPIGYVAIAGVPITTNQGFKNFVCKENTDPLFLFYKLKLVGKDIESQSSGSTFAEASMQVVSNFEILLPPIESQRSISKVLSSFDDKIELLKQQNRTLENIAQTLFKRWFVEFNFPDENGKPYKDNGGSMAESELGLIPKRWEDGVLMDLMEITTGKSLPKDKFNSGGEFKVIGANGQIGRSSEYLVDEKVIITGRVGTLGTIYIINSKVWISDNTLILKPIQKENFYFVFFVMKNLNFESLNRGSTQPLITQTDIKNIKVIIPNKNTLLQWNVIASSLFEKLSKNEEEIENLIKTRDTLLPKLMNGEIEVN